MGHPSVSCYQPCDDDDTDANADDAAFLSGTSIDICRPSRFSFQSFDDPLIRLYLILLFQEKKILSA